MEGGKRVKMLKRGNGMELHDGGKKTRRWKCISDRDALNIKYVKSIVIRSVFIVSIVTIVY